MIFEMGVFFGVVLIGYIYSLYKDYRGRMDSQSIRTMCALVVVLVSSSMSFTLHIGTTALMSCVWVGLAERGRA